MLDKLQSAIDIERKESAVLDMLLLRSLSYRKDPYPVDRRPTTSDQPDKSDYSNRQAISELRFVVVILEIV